MAPRPMFVPEVTFVVLASRTAVSEAILDCCAPESPEAMSTHCSLMLRWSAIVLVPGSVSFRIPLKP